MGGSVALGWPSPTCWDGELNSHQVFKAGALLPDTKLLLENWDEDADVPANLDRIRQENVFGKASRSRVEDILLILRQRYLKDPKVLKALERREPSRLRWPSQPRTNRGDLADSHRGLSNL